MNKKKTKKVPELRFPEFSGDWEFDKIDKYLVDYVEKVNAPTTLPIYSSTREGLKPQSEYYDNREIKNEGKYGVVPFGYFVYRHMSDDLTFKFNINNINSKIAVSKEYPVFKTVGLNPKILLEYLNNSKWFKKFAIEQKKGGTRTRLYLKVLKTLILPLPYIKEQKKVASFLSSVDERVGVLEKQKELLEKYKRGLMQKIFTQKIRFKKPDGTTYPDWQEKKLGDTCNVIGGGTPSTDISQYWNGEINWFTPSEIKHKYLKSSKRKITEEGLNNSSAKKLPIGSLILTTRATVGDVGISTIECSTNQGFQNLVVKENINNEFIYYTINNIKKDLIRRSSGSTFLEISNNEIKKINLKLPEKEEQKKIADFLSEVDEKIENLSKQISKTKKYKKSLLQKMLI